MADDDGEGNGEGRPTEMAAGGRASPGVSCDGMIPINKICYANSPRVTERNAPASAVPAITPLLTQPSTKVPLGGRSAGGPVEGPGEGPPGDGAVSGEVEEGAGDGTSDGIGDGEGEVTGVGEGDGGAVTGAGVGAAVGEAVGVAVGACAVHEITKTAMSIKDLNNVEEAMIMLFCLAREV
ncbi:hypothetical protein LXL04_014082 [Taraxacum kok-saghyz]